MGELGNVEPGDVVRLKGPATTQLVLVVDGPVGRGTVEPVDVLVAPVWQDVERSAASTFDVLCPPDTTGYGHTLVVAAWATATIPHACLGERVTRVEDPRVLEAIRDVRLALVDPHVAPPADLVGRLDFHSAEVPWHEQVRATLRPYWDGSAVGECVTNELDDVVGGRTIIRVSGAFPVVLSLSFPESRQLEFFRHASDRDWPELEAYPAVPPSMVYYSADGMAYRIEYEVEPYRQVWMDSWHLPLLARHRASSVLGAVGTWLRGVLAGKTRGYARVSGQEPPRLVRQFTHSGEPNDFVRVDATATVRKRPLQIA